MSDGPLVETSDGYYILQWCPVCGDDLGSKGAVTEHITTHSPEDFGLSPLGERVGGDRATGEGGEQGAMRA